MRVIVTICLVAATMSLSPAFAAIPQTISFQGVLSDQHGNRSLTLTFRIYAIPGETVLWTETHSKVAVTGGTFSVILGSVNPLTIGFDQQYSLGISVDGGPELTPRIPFTAAAYSLNARRILDGAVTSSSIASGQVLKSLNGLHDDATLEAGNNVTITPLGQTLKISASGSAGGLALPFSGSASSVVPVFSLRNTGMGAACIFSTNEGSDEHAVIGQAYRGGSGVLGHALGTGAGVDAFNSATGSEGYGLHALHLGSGRAIFAESIGGVGVYAETGGSGENSYAIYGKHGVDPPGANSAAVRGEHLGNGVGVWGSGTVGLYGTSAGGFGVSGVTGGGAAAGFNSAAVKGQQLGPGPLGYGIWGQHMGSGIGVLGSIAGRGTSAQQEESPGIGVCGKHDGNGWGVYGISNSGLGVYGKSPAGTGARGQSSEGTGIDGESYSGIGVHGQSATGTGILGETSSTEFRAAGVYGKITSHNSAWATFGVLGENENAGPNGIGVSGLQNGDGKGVLGKSLGQGIGVCGQVIGPGGYGGYFENIAGGIALRAYGRAEFEPPHVGDIAISAKGRVQVDVLEIRGGDVAERFEVADDGTEPGLVMSIDPTTPGRLVAANEPYDHKVAGVVSGAGDVRAGVVLNRDGSGANGTCQVALSGRVYCWCDATYGAISPGDLLTTSPTPGHAMRVPTDRRERASGAILGKALGRLESGKALVLVLVALQ